ncbi:MAG: hypothetical protein RIE73_31690 [Coleofasciculus sp. C1-SOL-03]
MGYGVWGVGYGVWGVGCGVWGVGCGVSGVGCGVSGVGCGVSGVGCRVWGVGCQVSGVGCRVSGVGCRVSGKIELYSESHQKLYCLFILTLKSFQLTALARQKERSLLTLSPVMGFCVPYREAPHPTPHTPHPAYL